MENCFYWWRTDAGDIPQADQQTQGKGFPSPVHPCTVSAMGHSLKAMLVQNGSAPPPSQGWSYKLQDNQSHAKDTT